VPTDEVGLLVEEIHLLDIYSEFIPSLRKDFLARDSLKRTSEALPRTWGEGMPKSGEQNKKRGLLPIP